MNKVMRSVGMLVIETLYSNPNGDPDCDGSPRISGDSGLISDVSVKRKIRDLVLGKGPAWEELIADLELDEDKYRILEDPNISRKECFQIIQEKGEEVFLDTFWDARVFGTTFLEANEAKKNSKQGSSKQDNPKQDPKQVTCTRTGAVTFGMGRSVAPIDIVEYSQTKMAPVQEGKSRGLAPMSKKVVKHAVYYMPFFVNPSAAKNSRCSKEDVQLLLRILPHVYSTSKSCTRPEVTVRHAWHIEFNSVLGRCEWDILKSLTPIRKSEFNADDPSNSTDEYIFPNLENDVISSIADHIAYKTDLVDQCI